MRECTGDEMNLTDELDPPAGIWNRQPYTSVNHREATAGGAPVSFCFESYRDRVVRRRQTVMRTVVMPATSSTCAMSNTR